MKMQAWTSPSHDNAHIPKKMFQATSWSSYNDHGREIVPPTILLFWNEIVIQIQPQSLPTWYEILKCYSFVPTQLSFYSPNVFHQYYPLGGNLKWRLLKIKIRIFALNPNTVMSKSKRYWDILASILPIFSVRSLPNNNMYQVWIKTRNDEKSISLQCLSAPSSLFKANVFPKLIASYSWLLCTIHSITSLVNVF